MVCEDCRKKLEKSEKLVTPEFTKGKSDYRLESSQSERKVNQNMILNKRKFMFDPMAIKCVICKSRVENKNKYCLTCAYTKGLCEMCGKKISDMKSYKFTDVDPRDNWRKNKMREKTKEISDKILEKTKLKEIVSTFSKVEDKHKDNKVKKEHVKSKEKDEIDFNQNLEDLHKEENENEINKIKNHSNHSNHSEHSEHDSENEYDEVIKI